MALFRDSRSVLFDLSQNLKKSPEPLLDFRATSEHMSALLPFKFPVSRKYDAILDSFVTTTPTMHVRAAKALFDDIMHKVYCFILFASFGNLNLRTDLRLVAK